MSNPASRLTAAIVTIAAIITLLVVAKPILLPFAVAVLVWYVIDALAVSIGRIGVGGVQPFRRVSLLLSLAIIVLLVVGVADMIGGTVEQVRQAAPGYQDNAQRILTKLSVLTGIEVTPVISDFAAGIDIGSAVGSIAGAILSLAGDAGMVAIYVMFLLIEQRHFNAKLGGLFPDAEREQRIRRLIGHIQSQIRQYLYLKTVISAVTGILSYLVLILVGVDYAAFWALLIFILNYIPTIGSLLGVAFPVALALVQFDTFTPFIVLLATLAGVQFLIGNVIEPRIMGQSLNLSPLVVILALSIWGQIWGITGMFLSVPITVILMIVLAHFDGSRPFALSLSENGRLSVAD